MDRAVLGDVELEYAVRGDGEPVVLIHPGIFVDWFTSLLAEPVLASRYRLFHYHRVRCAGSSHVAGPVSLSQQAAPVRSLIQHLVVSRAHIVGHSSSGNVALQVAVDSPDVVQSLAILEPALMSVPSAATSRVFVGTAVQHYRGRGTPVLHVTLYPEAYVEGAPLRAIRSFNVSGAVLVLGAIGVVVYEILRVILAGTDDGTIAGT